MARSIGLQSLSRGCVAISPLVLGALGWFHSGMHYSLASVLHGGDAADTDKRHNPAFDRRHGYGRRASASTGVLLRQYRAIFFALLNMAFSMIYGVLAKVESLGSTDGIGISQVTFSDYRLQSLPPDIIRFCGDIRLYSCGRHTGT